MVPPLSIGMSKLGVQLEAQSLVLLDERPDGSGDFLLLLVEVELARDQFLARRREETKALVALVEPLLQQTTARVRRRAIGRRSRI